MSNRIPRHAWPVVAAVAFVLAALAGHWRPGTGLTGLLRFGERYAPARLPVLAGLPLRTYAGDGYDGQFYAQLAVDPAVHRPEVQAALDNPRYRARRILLPAAIHLAGGGRPWLTLHLYVLAHAAAWLVLGWRLWRRVAGDGWHGTGVWLACMLGMGVLDCLRLSLTDLPAMLLVFLAVEAAERGRRLPALALFAAAALTRDTALLAAPGAGSGEVRAPRNWGRLLLGLAAPTLPLVLWVWWLRVQVPAGDALGTGHFTWPGRALLQHGLTCARGLAAGSADGRVVFGLLAAIAGAGQAVWVLRRLSWNPPPWLRAGAPFALLFFVLGDPIWHGYWAVARSILPLTFAYNLLLPRDRWFWPALVLGNLSVLHAVYRLLPD